MRRNRLASLSLAAWLAPLSLTALTASAGSARAVEVPPLTAVTPPSPAALPPLSEAAARALRQPVPTSDPRPLHALSLWAHGMFATTDLLSVGLQVAQPVTQGGIGISHVHRRGTLDVVTTVDLSYLSPGDGNFLAAGKNGQLDTHFTRFSNLNMVSVDVSLYYVKDLHPRVAFVLGAGIGLGMIFGDVSVVNNQGLGCAAAPGDVSRCHPVVNPNTYALNGNPAPFWTDAIGNKQPLSGDILPSDPNFQRKLDGLRASQADCLARKGGDCRDTAEHPYYHSAAEKPPVMVVINVQLGLKIKVHRHLNINVMGGFRDGVVVGGGPEYVF